jgi:hypothetical protein
MVMTTTTAAVAAAFATARALLLTAGGLLATAAIRLLFTAARLLLAASRSAARTAAAVVAMEQSTKAAAATAAAVAAVAATASVTESIGLRFQTNHDNRDGCQSQRKTNDVSHHQRYLQNLEQTETVNLMSDFASIHEPGKAASLSLLGGSETRVAFHPDSRECLHAHKANNITL